MTRAEHYQVKTLDQDILRAAFTLQNLIRARAALDPVHTIDLINGITETLKHAAESARKAPATGTQ